MADTEWICGSCKTNGQGAQPDKCPDCGDVHFWSFMHDPIVPVALRYATWLSSKLTAFRRLLH
jgi:hypothetical protein